MDTKPTRNIEFLLSKVQPALLGFVDGSLSTLAAVFAAAVATGDPWIAFKVGLANAIAAGISMAYSEGLSDTGEVTGRGTGLSRGIITGVATFLGAILHTLPFLIAVYSVAFNFALIVVLLEVVFIAWVRHYYYDSSFKKSIIHVAFAALVITAIGILIGEA